MAIYEFINVTMLIVMIASLVLGFFNRFAGAAMLTSFALFVISLWFPEPAPFATVGVRMHWFPASFAILLLTLFGTTATLLIGVVIRNLEQLLVRRKTVDTERSDARIVGKNMKKRQEGLQ